MADSCIFVAVTSDPVKSKQGFLSTGGSFKQTSLTLQSSPSSQTVQSWCSNGAKVQKTGETRASFQFAQIKFVFLQKSKCAIGHMKLQYNCRKKTDITNLKKY